MSTNRYQSELDKLPETYAGAMREDVARLKGAIAGASESSVIGVGSGGSFTVASLLCNLHEAYTGRVSRPSTPLEIICNPTLASSSPVFLISAEGKNPDITEALGRARHHSARPIHVLTNRSDSPLITGASMLSDVSTHVFELRDKDGYLATNSLLLDAVLVARAYGELDGTEDALPVAMADLLIGDQSVAQWLASAEAFIEAATQRGAVIVTYSPLLRPIAADLESKLSEGALLHCQLADLRSFAHGRHLWLAERPRDTVVLALIEPSLSALWDKMRDLFPRNVPTFSMPLPGALPRDLIAGLVAQMHLVDAIAKKMGKDPGQPNVPQFGRDIYYLDLPEFIPVPEARVPADEQSKYDVLGARWPSPRKRSDMSRARNAFVNDITKQSFRAVVFDYDGTLTASQRRTEPPAAPVVQHIQRLVEAGVLVGIASGRGDSIQQRPVPRPLQRRLDRLGDRSTGNTEHDGRIPEPRYPYRVEAEIAWRSHRAHQNHPSISSQHPLPGWFAHRPDVVRRSRCIAAGGLDDYLAVPQQALGGCSCAQNRQGRADRAYHPAQQGRSASDRDDGGSGRLARE